MESKTIGIVGGAGPLAGVALLERIFCYAQSEYGCFQDADFPKVIMVSFPFSDMLGESIDRPQVAKELRESLQFLKRSGASLIALACNTLHTFLDEELKENLVSLPETISASMVGENKPMILCTSTSRRSGLYDALFPCVYPNIETQKNVDTIINSILRGNRAAARHLAVLINQLDAKTVILGCTELSLYSEQLSGGSQRIIDPLDILAKELVKKSFS